MVSSRWCFASPPNQTHQILLSALTITDPHPFSLLASLPRESIPFLPGSSPSLTSPSIPQFSGSLAPSPKFVFPGTQVEHFVSSPFYSHPLSLKMATSQVITPKASKFYSSWRPPFLFCALFFFILPWSCRYVYGCFLWGFMARLNPFVSPLFPFDLTTNPPFWAIFFCICFLSKYLNQVSGWVNWTPLPCIFLYPGHCWVSLLRSLGR